jgi:hypothetical protein
MQQVDGEGNITQKPEKAETKQPLQAGRYDKCRNKEEGTNNKKPFPILKNISRHFFEK